jgi:hypothetical protein
VKESPLLVRAGAASRSCWCSCEKPMLAVVKALQVADGDEGE